MKLEIADRGYGLTLLSRFRQKQIMDRIESSRLLKFYSKKQLDEQSMTQKGSIRESQALVHPCSLCWDFYFILVHEYGHHQSRFDISNPYLVNLSFNPLLKYRCIFHRNLYVDLQTIAAISTSNFAPILVSQTLAVVLVGFCDNGK
jgi:hypothetical protein